MNPTIMWIAITVGILLYIIGYFAGGRLTLSRILTCTLLVTVIGVLALPAPMIIYRVVKKQFNVVTAREEKDGSFTKLTYEEIAPPSSADSAKTANGAGNMQETVSTPFQVLTLVMYIIWTAFLVGMGIFFYETLIVTAEEIDKR